MTRASILKIDMLIDNQDSICYPYLLVYDANIGLLVGNLYLALHIIGLWDYYTKFNFLVVISEIKTNTIFNTH